MNGMNAIGSDVMLHGPLPNNASSLLINDVTENVRHNCARQTDLRQGRQVPSHAVADVLPAVQAGKSNG